MTFDLTRILQSKRAFRPRLTARPIEEKLGLLDAVRERALAVREFSPTREGGSVRTGRATEQPWAIFCCSVGALSL